MTQFFSHVLLKFLHRLFFLDMLIDLILRKLTILLCYIIMGNDDQYFILYNDKLRKFSKGSYNLSIIFVMSKDMHEIFPAYCSCNECRFCDPHKLSPSLSYAIIRPTKHPPFLRHVLFYSYLPMKFPLGDSIHYMHKLQISSSNFWFLM